MPSEVAKTVSVTSVTASVPVTVAGAALVRPIASEVDDAVPMAFTSTAPVSVFVPASSTEEVTLVASVSARAGDIEATEGVAEAAVAVDAVV